MKVIIEVEVPEKATSLDIEDALLYKVNHNDWRKVIHRNEKEDTTDLEGKCGSCRHFRPIENMSGFSCYGKCARGCVMGQRTRRACKRYEK